MFGFSRRRKFLKLERRLARIEQAFTQLSQQLAHGHQAHGDPAGALVATLIDSQAKQFASSAEFLKAINDIGIDRASAALGRRGGKRRAATARRDERGRMLPGRRPPSDCPLCDDPLTADFSIEQWTEHQKHKGGGKRNERSERREREPEPIEIEPGETHVHDDGTVHAGPPHPQPQYPLPTVSIGDASGGTSGDPSAGETGRPAQQANGALVS